MSQMYTGLFETHAQASAAVDDLLRAGCQPKHISLVATETVGKENFGIQTKSKIAEGAAIGAGATGGIAALIAGFTSVGVLASTGVGLIAVGPVIAALAGAGAGAAVGGTLGGLIGWGISEHELKFYENAIEKGSVLVGVAKDDIESDDLKRIFKKHNAKKIASA